MLISGKRTRAIDRLRTLSLLQGASGRELTRIDRLTYEVEVAARRVVTREGDRPGGFFLILSGSAAVTVSGHELGVLGRGMFFGETALVDGGPEPATVTALTRMQLRVASRKEFVQLSELRPVARAILQTLAVQQRRVYDDGCSRLSAAPSRIGNAS